MWTTVACVWKIEKVFCFFFSSQMVFSTSSDRVSCIERRPEACNLQFLIISFDCLFCIFLAIKVRLFSKNLNRICLHCSQICFSAIEAYILVSFVCSVSGVFVENKKIFLILQKIVLSFKNWLCFCSRRPFRWLFLWPIVRLLQSTVTLASLCMGKLEVSQLCWFCTFLAYYRNF